MNTSGLYTECCHLKNQRQCVCSLSHQANGHADRIENIKPMFVEPKGKGTFTEVSVVLLNGFINLPLDNFSKRTKATVNLIFLSVLRLLTDITTKSMIQHLKEDPSLLCVEER